jgi:hypothetical protein
MWTRKASEMLLAPAVRRTVGEQIHLSVHGADCLILFARRAQGCPSTPASTCDVGVRGA